MNTSLEEEIRWVLADCADSVPADAVARVRSARYRPHLVRARTRRAFLTGGCVIALVVALTLGFGAVGPSKQSAFASWCAVPTTPAAGQVATAQSACTVAVTSSIATLIANRPDAPFTTDPAAWHVVLADTRGPYTLVAMVAADGSSYLDHAACLTDVPGWTRPEMIFGDDELAGPDSEYPPAAGEIDGPNTGGSGTGGYTVAIEQVGSGVIGVSLDLKDGTQVVATVDNRWYAARWPGNSQATSAEVATAAGTTHQLFPGMESLAGPAPSVSVVTPVGDSGSTGTSGTTGNS